MIRLFEFLLHDGRIYKVRKRGGPIPNPIGDDAHFQCFGVLLNWKAGWVGCHYSGHHKLLRVNFIPFLTVWWAQPGGTLP